MKKLVLLTIVIFLTITRSFSENYGQLIASNCYQRFVVPFTGGNYNVFAGLPIVFNSTNLLDFSRVNIYRSDNSLWGTVSCNTEIVLPNIDSQYFIYPVVNPGTIIPGGYGALSIKLVTPIPVIEYLDTTSSCSGFGDAFRCLLKPSLSGLCGLNGLSDPIEYTYTDPVTGATHNAGMGESVIINDNGFCANWWYVVLPDGSFEEHGTRCKPFNLTVKIPPCNFEDPFCPDLTLTSPISICCKNCLPGGGGFNGQPQLRKSNTEISEEITLGLRPNPTNNNFQIISGGVVEKDFFESVKIYTSSGILIEHYENVPASTIFQMESRESGIYFIKVHLEHNIYNLKILKK